MSKTLLIALYVAFGQGVPLPPLGTATVAPPVRPSSPEVLPDPREANKADRPLGTPPTLGQLPPAGSTIGIEVTAAPLKLEQVLASVDAYFPRIRAAEQERLIATGAQMTAQGAFDLNLRSQEFGQDGTYDSQRYSFFVDQQTAFNGASFFAGYRLGTGAYPVYYGDRKTAEGGEFRAGALFPLLRNRELDRFRATAQKADIDRQIAEPNIQRQRIDAARAASRAYWTWVLAGQRYLIARDVLELARRRDEQLSRRVAAGNLAPIEREDNRRSIVDREARVVAALRLFQQAGFALSLYHRDAVGNPIVPTLSLLPMLTIPVGAPDAIQRKKDLQTALTARPEVQRLSLARDKVNVDIRLAENQALPGMNVGIAGLQDVGFGKRSPSSTSKLDRQSVEVSLLFDVPLQRREARGRMISARAELLRIAAEEQLARDQISLELQDAANALDRAYELLRRGRDNRLQSDYMAEAERRLFDIGKSDQFRVNLRELTAAEARLLEIEAAAEFYRSLADYEAARGVDTTQK
ncbi:MAG: TolC family protein [Planctomycetia bacterium]|nr:TolC family protein [Planctomycetia bacterium]